MPLTLTIKPFDSLTLRELYDVLHLRDLVFVVGQRITALPEVDGEDPRAHHGLLRDDAGVLVGTVRVFMDEEPVCVGRVAVHPDRQRSGLGTQMMHLVHAWLGERPAMLHAQAHLEPWYASLGWEAFGDPYLEAEIPHISMRRPASQAGRP